MLTLIIETSTAACSVALIERRGESVRLVASAHEVVGRSHAERLIPMIAALPDGGRADRIAVDVGPGSFTGIRVGIAAARGLSLGWRVEVAGFSSLTLVAAAGLAVRDTAALAVVLEGGHGEVFMASYAPDTDALGPVALTPFASLRPESALAALDGRSAVGNGVRHLLALDPAIDAVEALPDAADAVLLPPADLPATPLYGRAPDAKLPGGLTPAAAV